MFPATNFLVTVILSPEMVLYIEAPSGKLSSVSMTSMKKKGAHNVPVDKTLLVVRSMKR